jgi:hypothetical protein
LDKLKEKEVGYDSDYDSDQDKEVRLLMQNPVLPLQIQKIQPEDS